MAEEQSLAITDDDMRRGGLPDNMKMAPGLAIYFVDALYQRCKAVALRMSEARGMVGPHLINNPGACMAIISRSITWNLDPFAVAQATYEVKGKIGYEGKLCQAILENSGSIEGQLKFEFFGDWDKLRGKFKMTGAVGSGERKPQQLWTDEDEIGLGVKVSAQVKGETTPREEEFFFAEMQPRNSTLWILRPKQQMRYATARAYGNLATPGIFMGIPFDIDPSGMGQGGDMVDITPPKPQRNEFERSPSRDPAMGDWIVKLNMAEKLEEIGEIRIAGLKELPNNLHAAFEEAADNRAHQIEEAMKAAEDREYEIVQKWQANLDAATKITQVANVRAGGLKELPEREHTAWNEACDVKAKDITDKPAGKKAAPKAEPKSEVETSMARGLRLLAGLDNADEINELSVSIAEELPVSQQNEWDKAIKKRLAEVKAK